MKTRLLLLFCLPVIIYAQKIDTHKTKPISLKNTATPSALAKVSCENGKADVYPCYNIDLVSFLPRQAMGAAENVGINDIWGWQDPETQKEYALVGRNDGVSFVDVTHPEDLIYIGNLPLTSGVTRPNIWRDMKVYQNYAFVVADGAYEHGMQVFDLTNLRNFTGTPLTFTENALYKEINSAHNIFINEDTGYAYIIGAGAGGTTCGGGLHMVNIQNPTQPTFAGCFSDNRTGRLGTGYSHDTQCVVYHGADTRYQGNEICFSSNETAVSIADVTDKNNPVALSLGLYPSANYAHQGWLSEDHKYFFMGDELDELRGAVSTTRTLIWDVSDLEDPILVTEYHSINPFIDHNQYIKGSLLYQSNYTGGLRIVDISDISNPIEIGYFDTYPTNDDINFNGSWSNYPYFSHGVIAVTSRAEGLFMVRPTFIEFSTYGVTSVLEGNKLEWSLANNPDYVSGFYVERGVVGNDTYEEIAYIPFSTTTETYSYVDYFGKISDVFYRIRVEKENGTSPNYSGIAGVGKGVPETVALAKNFPNPFNPSTVIGYSVMEETPISLKVYDITGREVATLVDDTQRAGFYRINFDASNLPSGQYYYVLQTNKERLTESMIVLK